MVILEPLDPNERFRERRRSALRRRRLRRLTLLGAIAVAAAGSTLAARWTGGEDRISPAVHRSAASPAAAAEAEAAAPAGVAVPDEIRGVHVTMALASVPGRLDEYLSLVDAGLNTIELDVKDESGRVGFVSPAVPLAGRIGAAQPFYDARAAAAAAEEHGIYLIGRVVVFEDPVLAEERPGMAIRTPGGAPWRNAAGLAWTNPYDERVWKYNVDVAEAAVRAGFDEIMFDYVRFPTDGDVGAAVYAGKAAEPRTDTIARFLEYATSRLKPLGARVSAAVFGLAATRNLGIGQKPRRIGSLVDAVYPMVYPSHYGAGEFDIADPNASPGLTVAYSLRDFRRALRNRPADLVPWLQDFSLGRTYGASDVRAQVDAARRQGVRGFLLWNPEGVYTPAALAPRPQQGY
jgi:hypothetical protein